MKIQKLVFDMENTCAHLNGVSQALIDATEPLGSDQEGLVYLSNMLSDHVREMYKQWDQLFHEVQEVKAIYKER